IGQHRAIQSTDFASGGTTLTLDQPWNVIPDATSRINIVTTIKQVAIYHNTLQGNSNFNVGSASSGVEIFQGGFDFVVARNTFSDFQWGINDFAYADTSGSKEQPLYSNLYLDNTISNCTYGITSWDLGNPEGEAATHLGNIYRNNSMSAIHAAGWYIRGGS